MLISKLCADRRAKKRKNIFFEVRSNDATYYEKSKSVVKKFNFLPLVSSFRLSFYFNFWNEGICAQVSAVCTVINTFIVSKISFNLGNKNKLTTRNQKTFYQFRTQFIDCIMSDINKNFILFYNFFDIFNAILYIGIVALFFNVELVDYGGSSKSTFRKRTKFLQIICVLIVVDTTC